MSHAEFVASNLRALLEGRTLRSVAERTGMSEPTINRVFSGERELRASELVAIAKALRTTPDAILFGPRALDLPPLDVATMTVLESDRANGHSMQVGLSGASMRAGETIYYGGEDERRHDRPERPKAELGAEPPRRPR